MNKYQNPTFKTIKEAIDYKESFETSYGTLESPIIKTTQATRRVPKGLIIQALNETEGSYVLSPFYGMGYYVFVSKQNCKRIG